MLKAFGHRRLTLDNPIRPDVWLKLAERPGARVDLIIAPTDDVPPGPIAVFLRGRLPRKSREEARIVYGRNTISASLTFAELITLAIPLTDWWTRVVARLARAHPGTGGKDAAAATRPAERRLAGPPDGFRLSTTYAWLIAGPASADLAALASDYNLWDLFRFAALVRVASAWGAAAKELDRMIESLTDDSPSSGQIREVILAFEGFVEPIDATVEALRSVSGPGAPLLWGGIWSINHNRPAGTALNASYRTVKADAARALFSIRADDITWAVVDGGIDARHPAFQNRSAPGNAPDPLASTRVRATYDFTVLRDLLATGKLPTGSDSDAPWRAHNAAIHAQKLRELRARQERGDEIDWSIVAPLIEIPHRKELYRPPEIEHGTHVAGILGGNWPSAENRDEPDLIGIAPDIRLLDIRVFDDRCGSNEDTIVYALQFLMHLNRRRDQPAVHGINLSMSLVHEVKSFACGQTPICIECNRISGNGIVVVAAAGNRGIDAQTGTEASFESYRNVSITDPGNADGVITVGATHRSAPHSYGVSYFSSRGPTGDGRRKPDLLAPGEKIVGPIPGGGSKPLDGTSMAAPHVSGAAALLMARHRELIGQPRRIKEILCRSATDLGREAHFQGAGLLDILRALQSV